MTSDTEREVGVLQLYADRDRQNAAAFKTQDIDTMRALAPRLIDLHVWCRQQSLNEVASHIGKAVDVLDAAMTGHTRSRD